MNEIWRKCFHLCGLLFPLIYYSIINKSLLTKWECDCILVFLTLFVVLIEIVRVNNTRANKLIHGFVGPFIRPEEVNQWSGCISFFFGNTVTLILFSPPIAWCSLLYLYIGDSVAALYGSRYGRPFYGNKSLEGFFAMFLACMILYVIVHFIFTGGLYSSSIDTVILPTTTDLDWTNIAHIPFRFGLDGLVLSSFFAAVAELITPRSFILNDNLSIPIVSGTVISLLNAASYIIIPCLDSTNQDKICLHVNPDQSLLTFVQRIFVIITIPVITSLLYYSKVYRGTVKIHEQKSV